MGWGDVGGNNPNSKIPTPNLNRLASEGMVFTDAHAGNSVCTPSRYSTLTGRYSWRGNTPSHAARGFSRPFIEKGRMTLGSLLKANGYATACFGKWHVGMGMPTTDGKVPNHIAKPTNIDWSGKIFPSVLDYGFDCYYGISGSLDMPPYVMIENDRFLGAGTVRNYNNGGVIGLKDPNFRDERVLPDVFKRACAYIEGRKGKPGPFFIYLPSPAPHAPCSPLPEFRGKTGLGEYGDYCMEQDVLVGELVRTLDKCGFRDNTLVIFASDNGFWGRLHPERLIAKGHYPNGPFRGYKFSSYEGGHRSPFFVRWPAKIKPGQRCGELVSLVDLLATFADIVDVKLPGNAGEDSASILPLLLGKTPKSMPHDYILMLNCRGEISIREKKWKLVTNVIPKTGRRKIVIPRGKLRVELYDMERDPGEKHNVHARHQDQVKRLYKKLVENIRAGRTAALR